MKYLWKGQEDNRGKLFGHSPCCPPKNDLLLLYCAVDVKSLYASGALGKGYPWPKPRQCPRCKGLRLWGHGYAERYFEGFREPLWVKRYRCPDCRAVHTCRPDGYFERYRYRVVTVMMSLLNKIIHGKWLRCISRQNQLPWYRAAWSWCSRLQSIATLSLEHLQQYVGGRLWGSKQSEQLRLSVAPHRVFA